MSRLRLGLGLAFQMKVTDNTLYVSPKSRYSHSFGTAK